MAVARKAPRVKPARRAPRKPAKKASKARPRLVIVGDHPSLKPVPWGLRWQFELKRSKQDSVARGRKVSRDDRPIAWLLTAGPEALDRVVAGLARSIHKGDVVLWLGSSADQLAPLREVGAAVGALSTLGGYDPAGAQVHVGFRLAFSFNGDRKAAGVAKRVVSARYGVLLQARKVDSRRIEAALGLLTEGATLLCHAASAMLGASLDPSPAEHLLRRGVSNLLYKALNGPGQSKGREGRFVPREGDVVAQRLEALAAHPEFQALYRAVVRAFVDGGLVPRDHREPLAASLERATTHE